MGSVFDTLLGAADAVVDGTFSEAFSFAPMRQVRNGEPVADDSRAAVASFQAVFDERGQMFQSPSQSPHGFNDRVSAEPTLSVRLIHLPQGVRKFDRFTRIKTGTTYEARAIEPDGLGRSVVTLAETRT